MSHHHHDAGSAPRHPVTAEEWDQRYSGDQVWSGEPNQALVAEATSLPGGRALDVGCGEGADAVWLAQRQWQVTALDISSRAAELTRAAAQRAGVTVETVVSPFVDAQLEGRFDLVSAMYPVLQQTDGQLAEQRLADLVAPGGTLLFVHHTPDPASGMDFAGLLSPKSMASFLALQPGWEVVTLESRDRHVATGGGAGHHQDDLLRAHRLA